LAQKLLSRLRDFLALGNAVSDTKVLSARILTNQLLAAGVLDDLQRAEFKVFSQFGEDGIIQYLVHVTRISPAERRFVEFGVENYQESNTRLLVLKDNWTGLVIDGDRRNIRQIKNDRIYWRHQLQASCAFIDAENINQLINAGGVGCDCADMDDNALVNTAAGATWVSIHHGGGTGIGYSQHAGMVVVADGTELAAQKLERVLTTDPGMGVIRHADAGYERAIDVAAERGVRIPMQEHA
jgi:hypothetical protein